MRRRTVGALLPVAGKSAVHLKLPLDLVALLLKFPLYLDLVALLLKLPLYLLLPVAMSAWGRPGAVRTVSGPEQAGELEKVVPVMLRRLCC